MRIIFEKSIRGWDSATVKDMINDMMHRINRWNDMDEGELYEFRLILNELIVNGAIHGNKGVDSKVLTAAVQEVNNRTLCICIKDEGNGFDYDRYLKDDYVSDASSLSERGRGLKLVRALCENVKFNANGSQVMVIKTINKTAKKN